MLWQDCLGEVKSRENPPMLPAMGSLIGGVMEILKVGDVVRLRSGGPNMTITSFANDRAGRPMVYCEWFDSNKKHFDFFCMSSLTGVDRADGTFPPAPLAARVVQSGM
jgi:uncharacterized protein YodC (DUF2158 family)